MARQDLTPDYKRRVLAEHSRTIGCVTEFHHKEVAEPMSLQPQISQHAIKFIAVPQQPRQAALMVIFAAHKNRKAKMVNAVGGTRRLEGVYAFVIQLLEEI